MFWDADAEQWFTIRTSGVKLYQHGYYKWPLILLFLWLDSMEYTGFKILLSVL